MKIELQTTEGRTFVAEVSYGRMTDNVVFETPLGTFALTGTSVRRALDQLLFLSTPPPPKAANAKKAA